MDPLTNPRSNGGVTQIEPDARLVSIEAPTMRDMQNGMREVFKQVEAQDRSVVHWQYDVAVGSQTVQQPQVGMLRSVGALENVVVPVVLFTAVIEISDRIDLGDIRVEMREVGHE